MQCFHLSTSKPPRRGYSRDSSSLGESAKLTFSSFDRCNWITSNFPFFLKHFFFKLALYTCALSSHYIALLDVPGIPRSNINVTLNPASNALRVYGSISCSPASEGTSYCLSRTVKHSVTLPMDADLEKGVEVGVRDGVLRVAVHRKAEGGEWKVLKVAEDR